MEKRKNIPVLRFPEFDGLWEKKKLGETTTNVMYGMNAAATDYDGIHKYIRITDIDENSREFSPNPLSSPDENPDEKYRLNNGDIVFARTGASVGKSYLYNEKDGDLYFAGFLIRFSVINANPYFVYTQTLLSDYEKWVRVMSMRSGQPGINAEEFKTLKLSFPTLPEQQKIASFFTAIDQKISQLKKKHQLLEQYKKGVMQKIFSQQIRFKDDDGRAFPKWEKKRLGDVVRIKKGEQLNKVELSETGSYPCINGGLFPSGFTEDYNSEENTITISEGGASCGFVNFLKTKFWCGGHCYTVNQMKTNKFSKRYLFQLLKYNEPRIMRLRVGSGLPNIQSKDINNLPLLISLSLPEQTKIANFLSAIDDKIHHNQKQIEQAEQWKKGLMQKMFI